MTAALLFAWQMYSIVSSSAVQRRKNPVVQGLVLMYASLFVLVNLATDVVYTWVDPRVKF